MQFSSLYQNTKAYLFHHLARSRFLKHFAVLSIVAFLVSACSGGSTLTMAPISNEHSNGIGMTLTPDQIKKSIFELQKERDRLNQNRKRLTAH